MIQICLLGLKRCLEGPDSLLSQSRCRDSETKTLINKSKNKDKSTYEITRWWHVNFATHKYKYKYKKDSFEIFEVHEETMLCYCDGLCSILGYVLSHTCMCYISLLRLVLVEGGGGYISWIYSVHIVLDTLDTYQLPHKCSGAKK